MSYERTFEEVVDIYRKKMRGTSAQERILSLLEQGVVDAWERLLEVGGCLSIRALLRVISGFSDSTVRKYYKLWWSQRETESIVNDMREYYKRHGINEETIPKLIQFFFDMKWEKNTCDLLHYIATYYIWRNSLDHYPEGLTIGQAIVQFRLNDTNSIASEPLQDQIRRTIISMARHPQIVLPELGKVYFFDVRMEFGQQLVKMIKEQLHHTTIEETFELILRDLKKLYPNLTSLCDSSGHEDTEVFQHLIKDQILQELGYVLKESDFEGLSSYCMYYNFRRSFYYEVPIPPQIVARVDQFTNVGGDPEIPWTYLWLRTKNFIYLRVITSAAKDLQNLTRLKFKEARFKIDHFRLNRSGKVNYIQVSKNIHPPLKSLGLFLEPPNRRNTYFNKYHCIWIPGSEPMSYFLLIGSGGSSQAIENFRPKRDLIERSISEFISNDPISRYVLTIGAQKIENRDPSLLFSRGRAFYETHHRGLSSHTISDFRELKIPSNLSSYYACLWLYRGRDLTLPQDCLLHFIHKENYTQILREIRRLRREKILPRGINLYLRPIYKQDYDYYIPIPRTIRVKLFPFHAVGTFVETELTRTYTLVLSESHERSEKILETGKIQQSDLRSALDRITSLEVKQEREPSGTLDGLNWVIIRQSSTNISVPEILQEDLRGVKSVIWAIDRSNPKAFAVGRFLLPGEEQKAIDHVAKMDGQFGKYRPDRFSIEVFDAKFQVQPPFKTFRPIFYTIWWMVAPRTFSVLFKEGLTMRELISAIPRAIHSVRGFENYLLSSLGGLVTPESTVVQPLDL